VVALSDLEAAYQRKSFDLGHALHMVIPNGVPLGVYACTRRNQAGQGQPWRLLYVGQLIALKRVDVLLHALAQCPPGIELDLAYHTDTLEADLQRLTASLGLQSRVHFLGATPPNELARLYQQADVLVLPSASEALPTVVTEAMACGTPVIATRVGGVPEQLAGSGLLVSPGSVDELARAIRHMLDNYEPFAARATAMSRTVRERFSSEQMIRRHVQLYESLLKRNRRRLGLVDHAINAITRLAVEPACARRRPCI
jgi:glycosyltransferase involved in cell wall biosynthesis